MLSLDDEEVGIALVALKAAYHRGGEQVAAGWKDGCNSVAWFCTKHCVGKFETLISRIEQYQQDQENGDV